MADTEEVKELLNWMKKWDFIRYVSAGDEGELEGVDPACIWTEISDGLNGSWAYNNFETHDGIDGYLVVGKARPAGDGEFDCVMTEVYEDCAECGGEDDECEECDGDFLVPVDVMDLAVEKYKTKTNAPAPSKSNAGAAKFCSNCGTSLTPGQKFCSDCGHKL